MAKKNRVAISLDDTYIELYQDTAALLGMSASSYIASILIEYSPRARAAKNRVIKDLADDIKHFENIERENEESLKPLETYPELNLNIPLQKAKK
jgi:hypothetical protein